MRHDDNGAGLQLLALQLLLERMTDAVELVYDKTSGEVRSFWSMCTREVLAVVLKDLYHNAEHGTPWYDEWVGQFLPEESSTNAAPSDNTLHPIVDPAHGMEDLYATAADMGDSDGSASTVDWDALAAARNLLYHVRLLELLCACTAGQVRLVRALGIAMVLCRVTLHARRGVLCGRITTPKPSARPSSRLKSWWAPCCWLRCHCSCVW